MIILRMRVSHTLLIQTEIGKTIGKNKWEYLSAFLMNMLEHFNI